MWCSLCRTDVSARTTGHAGGLLCARCGHDLLSETKPNDAIRQAREILERWNSSDLFERISRTESLDAFHTRMDAVKKSSAPPQLLRGDLLESASSKKTPRAEVADEEHQRAGSFIESQPIDRRAEPIAPQALEEARARIALADPDEDIDAGSQLVSPLDSDASAVVTQQETEAPEIPLNDAHDILFDSAALPAVALETLEPAIQISQTEPHPAPPVPAAHQPMRMVNLSELTHIDILSVRTVASSRVTGKGITQELQRVIDLAKSQNADPMRIPEDDTAPVTLEIGTDGPPAAEAANATEPTRSLPPAFLLEGLSYANSLQSPQIPAETANTSEPAPTAVPKTILRSPMRRPLLHRRFQLERPATTSSTGSENVNRELRVDQPGGQKDLLDVAAMQQHAAIASAVALEMKILSNSPKSGRRVRIDPPESVDDVTGTDGRRGRTQTRPKQRYIDDAHDASLRGPHFEVTPPRRPNLTSVTGQFLAYLGVLGLTIGTAMVIYGHFGGYSEYTPTGWLVTTVAQMLLFLGVINLVSGGIEQNNDDVSRRINTLGEQLLRIEQVTADAMKRPKIDPRLYDNPNADVEETSHETAGIRSK